MCISCSSNIENDFPAHKRGIIFGYEVVAWFMVALPSHDMGLGSRVGLRGTKLLLSLLCYDLRARIEFLSGKNKWGSVIVTVSQLETQLWVELEHFPRDLLTRIGLRFHFDRRVERPSLSPHLSSVRSRSVVPSNSPWSSSFARLTSFPTITHRCNNAVCSRSPNLGSGLVLRKVGLACSVVLVQLQSFIC